MDPGPSNRGAYFLAAVAILILIVGVILIFTNGPKSCATDADCGTGKSCFRSTCTDIPSATYSVIPCTTNTDCSYGYICTGGTCKQKSCVGKSDCGPGTVCDPDLNACTAPPVDCSVSTNPGCSSGDSCTSTIECGSGMVCLSGQCKLEGAPGQSCGNDYDCYGFGVAVTPNQTGCVLGTCNTPSIGLGKLCSTSTDCTYGFKCSLGVCQQGSELGGPCVINSECAYFNECSSFGTCVEGTVPTDGNCTNTGYDYCQYQDYCNSDGKCRPKSEGNVEPGGSCTLITECGYGYTCSLDPSPVCSKRLNLPYDYCGTETAQSLKNVFATVPAGPSGVHDTPITYRSMEDIYTIYGTTNFTYSGIANFSRCAFPITNGVTLTKRTGNAKLSNKKLDRFDLPSENSSSLFVDDTPLFTSTYSVYDKHYLGTEPLYRHTLPATAGEGDVFHRANHQFLAKERIVEYLENDVLTQSTGVIVGFCLPSY